VSPHRPRAAGDRSLNSRKRRLSLDLEVRDLLRHDPELLAIADAVAVTQLLDADDVPNATLTGQDLGAQARAVRE
jgi:hypothetical protein